MDDVAVQGSLVGRERELELLEGYLANAAAGKGGTVLISGEAGIGKTRLMEEFKRSAKAGEFVILSGAAAADALQPFLVFSDALEGRIDRPLFLEQEHISFAGVFAVDRTGQLLAKATPDEEGLDADVYAGTLSAVQDFVRDSFDSERQEGLGRLEYGDVKMLMEHGRNISLTAVFRGAEHPDMRNLIRKKLREMEEHEAAPGSGKAYDAVRIGEAISPMLNARFLVRRDLEGVRLEQERLRIANQVLELLVDISGKGTLVIVLEDIHWADASSLFVLNYLARNVGKESILMVCTMRPKESGTVRQVAERMAEEGVATELALGKLGREDIEVLVDRMFAGNDFPRSFTGQLAGQCEGNPFFVIEMLRHMRDEGIIVETDDGHRLVREDYTVPATVEEVVHRRLETLSPDAMVLAEYTSCIGRAFDTGAALSLDSLKDPSGALEELKGSGMVVAWNGTAEFSHAIFRDVIYGSISERWRSAHHKSLGEYYERAYENRLDKVLYELARHFSLSNEHQKAYDYCLRAGDVAEQSFAAEQAVDFFDKALERLPKLRSGNVEEMEAGLLERLGDLHALAGDLQTGIDEYRKAIERQPNKRKRADMHRKLAIIYEKKGEFQRNMEECGKGLELLEGGDTIEKARILSAQGFAHMRMGEFQRSEEVLRESLRLAEAFDDRSDIAMAHHSMGTMFWHKGQLDDAFEHLERAIELREQMDDKVGLSRSYNNIGLIAFNAGKMDKALEHWNRSMELFRITGDIANMAVAIGNIGTIYLVEGDFDEALRHFQEGLGIRERIGDRRGIGVMTSNIGALHDAKGNVTEAEEYFARSLEIFRQIGDPHGMGGALNNMGNVHFQKGEVDRAKDYYDQGLAQALEIGDKRAAIHNYCGLVDVGIHNGDAKAALGHAESALEAARELKSKGDEGLGHRAMGKALRELDEWDRALEEFDLARNITEASGDKDEMARLNLEEGRLWKARGDGTKARERFGAALEYYRELGNKLMVRRLEEESQGL